MHVFFKQLFLFFIFFIWRSRPGLSCKRDCQPQTSSYWVKKKINKSACLALTPNRQLMHMQTGRRTWTEPMHASRRRCKLHKEIPWPRIKPSGYFSPYSFTWWNSDRRLLLLAGCVITSTEPGESHMHEQWAWCEQISGTTATQLTFKQGARDMSSTPDWTQPSWVARPQWGVVVKVTAATVSRLDSIWHLVVLRGAANLLV